MEMQELQADLQRRQRIQHAALLLEEGYKAERAANKLVPDAPSPDLAHERITPPDMGSGVDTSATERPPIAVGSSAPPSSKKERMMTPPVNPQPPPETEAWSPKVARRGKS